MRPTGNWSPALAERVTAFFLSAPFLPAIFSDELKMWRRRLDRKGGRRAAL
jgi:hypothetical protein